MGEVWVEWSPPYAPHVRGRYTSREVDPETGVRAEQRYEARCVHAACAGKETLWRGACLSGQVRQHIANYAMGHVHDDPLARRLGR